jgi:hypothetical protein
MDYLRIVEDLVSEYDLDTETGRKKAYVKCHDYAGEHIPTHREYNAFMEVAAVCGAA